MFQHLEAKPAQVMAPPTQRERREGECNHRADSIAAEQRACHLTGVRDKQAAVLGICCRGRHRYFELSDKYSSDKTLTADCPSRDDFQEWSRKAFWETGYCKLKDCFMLRSWESAPNPSITASITVLHTLWSPWPPYLRPLHVPLPIPALRQAELSTRSQTYVNSLKLFSSLIATREHSCFGRRGFLAWLVQLDN